jgi:GAF domain-containing protein/HAMP domain-containing protein
MDNKDIFKPRYSIRTRLLSLLLGLTTASVAIIAYLGVNSILRTGQSAQLASSARLRAQSEEYLVQLTVVTAERNDQFLQQVRQDAQNVARYAAAIFDHPEAFSSQDYWRAKDHMFRGSGGQYINGKDDVSSVFVPNSVKVDDEFITQMELASYLDFQFIPVYESSSDRVAIYYISKQEMSRLYPNINLGEILEPNYLATQDIFFAAGAPQNNPKREVVWTPVYNDPAGQGLLVTAVAPIYTSRGEFLGIIGIDISLARLSSGIEAASPVAGGYSFLVNNEGRAIALPKQGYSDILGREPKPGEFGPDLSAATSEFAPVLTSMMAGSKGFRTVQAGKRELLVAYAPLASTRWSLATVVQTESILQAVADLQKELNTSTQSLVVNGVLPIGGIILIVALVVGLLLTNRLVSPLQRLATAAQEIGAGKWDIAALRTGNDEIGVLSRAFNVMTTQIRELVSSLEQRVADRTHELERRAAQIAAGAEISRTASQELDPERLLRTVVDLIAERFQLYYAAVFVVDESGQQAVLHAGSGAAGQTMMERGHKLAVGDSSMVGWACAHKQARIALDVGEEAVRFANPLLPLTRSEMALPLRVGDRVIGALDIQSTQAQAFDEGDITALQGMADQIAVALENARLFQQAQSSLKEVERVNRLLTQQGWETFLRSARTDFAEFHQPGIASLTPQEVEELTQKQRSPDDQDSVVSIPLRARGQVLGTLVVEQAADRPEWTATELGLLEEMAAQAAQALESARLYQDTQRRAAREQLTSQVTARIRESLDMEAVLKSAAEEMQRIFNLAEAEVRIGTAPAIDQTRLAEQYRSGQA